MRGSVFVLINDLCWTDNSLRFNIDREKKSCRTPRRNEDVEKALKHFEAFSSFSSRLKSYFSTLFNVQKGHGIDLQAINDNTVFVPVVPLFVPSKKEEEDSGKSNALVSMSDVAKDSAVALTLGDLNKFLDEQKRSISEKLSSLAKVFPDNGHIVTIAEANMMVVALHSVKVSSYYVDGVNYIEDMLRKQLIAAIGKEVTPVDFANYMVFHNRKVK